MLRNVRLLRWLLAPFVCGPARLLAQIWHCIILSPVAKGSIGKP